MPQPLDPRGNHLLAALPSADYQRLLPDLTHAPMVLGTVLCEPHGLMDFAYFPIDAIVSLLCVTENGGSAEIAVIGNEGLVGVSLILGGDTSTNQAVVQAAGHAYKLPSHAIKHEFHQGGALQTLLLRYTLALLAQVAQTAVCNRHHSLDQQLCRWLLLSDDRLPSSELIMTQELIANMLGVRREGVTAAAGRLLRAGLIRYRRGHITILNRPGLEARTCECYVVVKNEYDRLLLDMPATQATPTAALGKG